jgi:hypothetical protein
VGLLKIQQRSEAFANIWFNKGEKTALLISLWKPTLENNSKKIDGSKVMQLLVLWP